MSEVVRTYIHGETGHTIQVYKSGAERDVDTGRLVRGADAGIIRTAEKSTEYHRRRQEKHAAELRRRIRDAARDGMPPGTLVRHSADAFAAAGAMLFEEVVMNSDAYPRDRMQAYETLGRAAGVIAERGAAGDQPGADAARLNAAAAAVNADAARLIARVMSDVLRLVNPSEVVDGTTAPPGLPPGMPADQPGADRE